jgi:hypothetical protein
MMAYDLAAARVRIGLNESDTTKDAMLTIAMNASLGEAQRYCNRTFFYTQEEAEFIHFSADIAQLGRYPLRQVLSVQADSGLIDAAHYHIHNQEGKIVFDYRVVSHTLRIRYEGGYVQLPSELEVALWLIFDAMWAALDVTGSTASTGSIKTISVPDVGSITYADTSKTGSSTDAGPIPGVAKSILDLFRMIVC